MPFVFLLFLYTILHTLFCSDTSKKCQRTNTCFKIKFHTVFLNRVCPLNKTENIVIIQKFKKKLYLFILIGARYKLRNDTHELRK